MTENSVAVRVAVQLKDLGSVVVEDAAVRIMVDREVKRRTDAVVTVIDKMNSGEREFRKLGPDVIGYAEDGKKVSESFSKARIDERAAATGKATKLRKALDKALNDGDFSDVCNLANEKAG